MSWNNALSILSRKESFPFLLLIQNRIQKIYEINDNKLWWFCVNKYQWKTYNTDFSLFSTYLFLYDNFHFILKINTCPKIICCNNSSSHIWTFYFPKQKNTYSSNNNKIIYIHIFFNHIPSLSGLVSNERSFGVKWHG